MTSHASASVRLILFRNSVVVRTFPTVKCFKEPGLTELYYEPSEVQDMLINASKDMVGALLLH